VQALNEAAKLALRRLRGDEGYRLLIEAARIAEAADDRVAAARTYADAVEVASRMAGISGRFKETDLQELLDRAERLAPDPDPHLRAHLTLDRSWISWSFGRTDEMADGADEALELARSVDDVLLLSSALDAASAKGWWEGDYPATEALSRERFEALSRAPESALVAVERSDAISMITEALIHSGRLREALDWDELNRSEIAANAPRIAGTRSLQAMYHLGEWETALERGARVRENWFAEGQPRSPRSPRASRRSARSTGSVATTPLNATGSSSPS
jgi:hypothetical protein